MEDLRNKTAIITGGASGIGRATALALSKAGSRTVIADIDDEGAAAVAHEIEAAGGESIGVCCDVGVDSAFTELAEAALKRFGRVDIVMNNVGVMTSGRPEELPLEEWQRVFNTNFMSVVRSNLGPRGSA